MLEFVCALSRRAPLTPNGLNGGKAGFPEYHHVYVQEKNLEAYQRDGVFPERTVIVKELVLLKEADYPDGSSDSPSGRGFGAGEFNGMDVTVKDSKRYAKTNGWGFYNFGHHALPYEATSKEASEAECAGCHRAGAAKTDMTWVSFYPVLRGKELSVKGWCVGDVRQALLGNDRKGGPFKLFSALGP